jgi:TetR/AcrR family fatty acid metabolism transcriptional regulator
VDNPIEKLRLLIKRHLEEFQSDRQMAIVYQTEIHRYNRIGEEMIKEMSKMYLDIVSGILEQGQEEGTMRRNLYTGLVKRMIIGSVDEVINTWLHSDRPYDLVSMSDPLVDLLIKGIGCDQQNTNGGFTEKVVTDI